MLEAKCDFLEFTVPYERRARLLAALRPGGVEPLDRGWRGYTHSALVAGGKGRAGWSPDREAGGFHVSLGSQGLGVMAGLDDSWADLPGVLTFLRDDLGGHATRFDVAWDDRDGALDLDVIERALESGAYTSRWRGGDMTKGFGCKAGGRTFYLGAWSSDCMLRIYDKAAERRKAGEDVDGHWVRVELQFRRSRADAVAALFQKVADVPQETFAYLAGVLRGYLEFKEPNANDTNKARWPVASWWARFLGFVEKARLVSPEGCPRTLEDVRSWISAQVSPSLALLEEGMGPDEAWAFLFAEAKDGRSRWGPRHRAILAASGAG